MLSWLGVAAAVLAVAGGLGTWATALGFISLSGTRGDGWVVVAAGVVGGAALVFDAVRPRAWAVIVAVLAGAGGAVVSGIDLHQVAAARSISLFGERLTLVEPGWGIYLSVGASVALAVIGLALVAGRVGGAGSAGRRRLAVDAGLAVLAVAAGVGVAVLLSGLGTKSPRSVGDIQGGPTAPSSARGSFAPERSFHGQAKANDGSTFDVAIDVGRQLRATAAVPTEFADVAMACTINERRDIVVPMRVSLTNTGRSDQDIASGLVFRGLQSTGPRAVSAEVASTASVEVTSNGATADLPTPQCDSVHGTSVLLEPIADRRVPPGAHRTHELLVVVRNYYSPESPGGRAADLARVSVSLYSTQLSCFSGDRGSGGRFYLDGLRAPRRSLGIRRCPRTT